MASIRARRGGLAFAVGAASLLTAGCATLPSSGPTAHQIVSQGMRKGAPIAFNVVNLDQTNVEELNASATSEVSSSQGLASLAHGLPRGIIGPGDTLQISLYEVGVSLFSGSRATAAGADSFDSSAHGQEISSVTVDQAGNVRLPFAGTIQVSGMTPMQVEQNIERRLADQSQHPQVVVTVSQSIFSSVVVSGDVRKPGRITLTSGQERIVDAIAAAGGTDQSIDDIVLRFVRNGQRFEERLGDIEPGSATDLVLDPGDRIEVIRAPRTFTVFGAAGKVSEVAFQSARVSLAEAIARAGGPNDAVADSSGIFLFRLGAPLGASHAPNIYRINMLDAKTYFLAQKVALRDKDLIYFANARSNQPSKFVAIISQLFSPVLAARVISQ